MGAGPAEQQVTTLPPIRCGAAVGAFSTRRGGVSGGRFSTANMSLLAGDAPDDVHTNRRLLLDAVGVPGVPIVTARQTHSARVRPVGRHDVRRGRAPDLRDAADGLVTRERGIALLVGAADCAPVVMLDSDREVVGVLHVGWRGLLGGVVAEGIRQMLRAGARLQSISVRVGPTIGPCCYPVGADVAAAVTRALPGTRARTSSGAAGLDLRRGVTETLGRSGVDDVDHVGGCTAEQRDTFFSRRRDGDTGCQAGIAVLTTG